MIGYLVSVLCMVLTAIVLQQFMPAIEGLYDARILIVPLVFLCSSVTVSMGSMLVLAFICGFLWDAQHLPGVVADLGNTVYTRPAEMLRFGYSIVLYASMGFLMQGIRPLFREGKWHVSALLTGVVIFLYLFAEFMLITFVRGEFILTRGIMLKISFCALLTMLFSPLVFWVLFKFAALFNHTIRYDGLKTRRRA
jgi:hypothetical protein